MSRSTRALVATGAAVALLAGSGATFARWYDEKTLSESRVATGTLSLTTTGTPTWTINTAATDENGDTTVPFDPATDKIVPGDVVEYSTTVTLHLQGKNLHAALGVVAEEGYTLAEGVTATPSYDCGNVNLADITTADDGKSCNVKILVQYTFGADNTHSGIIENNGDGTHEGTGWQKAPEGQGKALDVPSFKVVLEQKMRPSL